MKHHPFPLVRGNLIPLLGLLAWFSGGGLARAITDLLVSNPSTSSILRFDGVNGAPKGVFITSGSGGLVSPKGLAVGPDANLYVVDQAASRVKRYSLVDGSFLGNYTPADLVGATALQFGPEADLYVLGGGNQYQIRRYHNNGTSGDFVSAVVSTTSSRMAQATEFLFMPGSNDFLVTNSALNCASRFAAANGAFVSYYLNTTCSNLQLSQPRGLVLGSDQNYWVSSRGLNRITRYTGVTGAKINEQVNGGLLNAPEALLFTSNFLFVANKGTDSILRYIWDPGTSTLDAGITFVQTASQGLESPEYMVRAFINEPPVVNAGIDLSVPAGEPFSLTSNGSFDPDGVFITRQWTQLAGAPLLAAPFLVSGSTTSAAIGCNASYLTGPHSFQLTVSDGYYSRSDTVLVTVTAPLDINNDGLPDRLQAAYPTLTGNATADDDADGTSNLSELHAGTDPTSAASLFHVLAHGRTQAGMELQFSSVPTRHYELQRATDLGTWLVVAGQEDITPTGAATTVTDPNPPPGSAFYRIAVKPGSF
jgi:hypothetical protein